MARPLTTVLIDTYNHERFIAQAIESVLEQDFPAREREILVVDDGSTDRTSAIIQKFTPCVRYLRKANGGQASAFNAGIPEARGKIVAFLDGDDWWVPTKLTKVVEVLDGNPGVGAVGHGITEMYSDGRQQSVVPLARQRFRANTPEGGRTFRLRKTFLGTSRLAARVELLYRILPVPESLTIEADEYLFTLLAAIADVVILPESLTSYRIHGANLYLLGSFGEDGARRKQRSLAQLAERLSDGLFQLGLSVATVRSITDVLEAEANQMRLALDSGYPWETLQTELKIYRTLYERVSPANLAYKYLSLIPALFLPARVFYRARRRLAESRIYRRLRSSLIPFPKPDHVAQTWRTGS